MSLRLARGAQLNWLGRYLPLRRHLDVAARSSLLDVGCGPSGIACAFDDPFVGADVAFSPERAPSMVAVQIDPGPLPFADGAFHTVVCLDTLEHVPPSDRAGLVSELRRVAASQVLVGCPTAPVGQALDALAEILLARTGQDVPAWAREHAEHGLPTPEDLDGIVARPAGWRVERVPTPGALASAALCLSDLFPESAQFGRAVLPADPEALAAWLDAGDFGPPLRVVYRLSRAEPVRPAFDASRPETLAAAMRCASCGRSRVPDGGALRCAGCGERVVADATGAWLADSPRGSHRGPATTFVLAPDWTGSSAWAVAVHNYLHAFDAGAPHRLCLRLAPGVTQDEALALLAPVLAPFGDRPFAEILLEEDPAAALPGDRQVPIPPGAPLEWTPDRFRAAVRPEEASA